MTDVDINTVQLGDQCYHKATNKKCVVIAILDKEKKIIAVRDSDNNECEYYAFELNVPQHLIQRTPSWAERAGY